MASARPTRSANPSEPKHSATRPAPARRQQPGKARLKVIAGGREAAQDVSRSRPSRSAKSVAPAPGLKFVAAATAVVAACVFGVVLLQVMLAQTSFELHKIHTKLVSEETKYRHMRFEVANAEAPEKINQAAATLGLVVPAEQRYVFGPNSPGSSDDGSTPQARQPNDKAGLKAVLSKQP